MGEDSEEEKPVLVLDSSVLITFMELDRMDILLEMNNEYRIVIPRSVEQEVTRANRKIPNGIQVVDPEGSFTFYSLSIGPGESEVIELTQQLINEGLEAMAVLDDKKARSIAVRLGLPITGTLGLIELAKKEHIINKTEAISLVKEISHTSFYATQHLKSLVIEKMQSQDV